MPEAELKAEGGAPVPNVGHVLHVISGSTRARLGPMFTQVVQGLGATGTSVAVLSDDPQVREEFEGTPISCHVVSHLRGWRAWGLWPYLAGRLTPLPAIIHAWGTHGLWWIQQWIRRRGVRLLVHVFDLREVEHVLRGLRTEWELVGIASQRVADEVAARDAQLAARCVALPPALAPPLRPVGTPGTGHTFVGVCVGRIAEGWGLEVLIDAAAQLRRDGRDFQFAVVGEGVDVDPIWRRAREAGVQECISLVDAPELWERVLPEIDACILPGPQQELTLAPLMAMALGKPVIAAREQPVEWFVEDRTAWQFTPGSAVELAYLLGRLMDRPRQAGELGASASEFARQNHAVRDAITGLAAVYGRLTSSAAGNVSSSREVEAQGAAGGD